MNTHTQKNVTLAQKVAALKQAGIYPDPTPVVETIETHMSWVFLTRQFAYKLKKPVRYDFLDFSTLDLRQQNCETEVRLNRRLAGDVYLGVVPLTVDGKGELSLGNQGQVVDWLVKMKRLPRELMLDQKIKKNHLTVDQFRLVAETMTHFYQQSVRQPISYQQYRQRLIREMRVNESALMELDSAVSKAEIKNLFQQQQKFFDQHGEMLEQRVREGHLVEAHGDLRPEHVCLSDPPIIIDCLEFNLDLRTLDPVDELSFLEMECEAMGVAEPAREILRTYQLISGDEPPGQLIAFYKAYRACLRARLSILHIRELPPEQWKKWQQRTRTYLRIAKKYTQMM